MIHNVIVFIPAEKENKADTKNVMVWLYACAIVDIHMHLHNMYKKEKDACKKELRESKKKNTQTENHSYSRKNGPAFDFQCQTMFLQIVCLG